MLCGSLKELTVGLADIFKEVPISSGVTSRGRLLTVFVSSTTGSWSVVITWPSKYSCVERAGDGWRGPEIVKYWRVKH